MGTKSILFAVLTAIILESCITSYYQVYKVIPAENIKSNENQLVYEDENCKVYYDLWAENGNIGFRLYNKTEQNIYLNLAESFFILNGIAYDYYPTRYDVKSAVTGKIVTDASMISDGSLNLAGYSVSYKENKIVCIPWMTSKIITEYSINKALFRDCDLFKYPTKKQIKAKYFTKSNSPIVFSNRLMYTLGQSDVPIQFRNEFYVAEITNYPESEILGVKYEVYCGQKSSTQSKYIKGYSPDKFYIKYSKGTDSWKH